MPAGNIIMRLKYSRGPEMVLRLIVRTIILVANFEIKH
jgi:hypothetical protein